MRIEVQRGEIKSAYLFVIVLDLIFLFMNTPWMSLPLGAEGQPVRLASVFDFVKYQLDLKNEQNVATWYSSVILLAAGMMALLNGWYRPARGNFAWLHRGGWSGMALVLIALSADETATVHESLARMFNAIEGASGRAPSYRVGAGDWIPILLPLMIVIAAGMLGFFVYVFRQTASVLLLALAGTVLWICALFAESIEAGLTKYELVAVDRGFLRGRFRDRRNYLPVNRIHRVFSTTTSGGNGAIKNEEESSGFSLMPAGQSLLDSVCARR